jgi:multiple sugar transport system substrate-binding protein
MSVKSASRSNPAARYFKEAVMARFQPIPRQLSCALAISTLLASPLPALAADLKIFWDEGFYPEEDAAIEAVVAAYEQKSGKDVELTFYSQDEVLDKTLAALDAGDPPDVALAFDVSSYVPKWALDGALADMSDVVAPIKEQFYPGVLDIARLRDGATGKTAYYAVPIEQFGNYIHVWKSLLDQAGIGVEQIPREWDAFWAFGATRCSRPCARPPAATTSTASASPCRPKRATP